MVSHILWNCFVFFIALCLLKKATPPHNVAEFKEKESKRNGTDYYLDSKQGQQGVWEGFTNLKQTASPTLISLVSKQYQVLRLYHDSVREVALDRGIQLFDEILTIRKTDLNHVFCTTCNHLTR